MLTEAPLGLWADDPDFHVLALCHSGPRLKRRVDKHTSSHLLVGCYGKSAAATQPHLFAPHEASQHPASGTDLLLSGSASSLSHHLTSKNPRRLSLFPLTGSRSLQKHLNKLCREAARLMMPSERHHAIWQQTKVPQMWGAAVTPRAPAAMPAPLTIVPLVSIRQSLWEPRCDH